VSNSAREAFRARVESAKKKRLSRPAERTLAVGIAFAVAQGPAERPDTVDSYVDAFLSTVWLKPLRQLISQSVGGRPHPRRAGVVPTAERAAVLRELLVHPDLWEVTLYRDDNTTGDHESLAVVTRADDVGPAPRVYGHQTLTEEPALGDAWVGAMLTLADKVGVHHGVIPVMNPRAVPSEATMGGIFRNGIDQYPFPDQLARMRAAGPELASKYVRFPRWGTLYGRAHIEALGGVGKIVDSVKPAVVRELPAALYVQLTGSVATATSDEAAVKQRAFTQLVAPLLPPPISA
jgi:hypothetical protein